jgi:hypothetical protein
LINEEEKIRCMNENASQLKSCRKKIFAFIIKSFIDLHISKVNTSWGKSIKKLKLKLTSPKRFLVSKCNVGILWEFFRNSLGIL